MNSPDQLSLYTQQLTDGRGNEIELQSLSPLQKANPPMETEDFGPAVSLTDVEIERIKHEVSRIAEMVPSSIEFTHYCDRLHLRVGDVTTTMEDAPVQNTNTMIQYLERLQKTINLLFPDATNPDFNFRKTLNLHRHNIEEILLNIKRGRPYIRDDLSKLDDRKAKLAETISRLRKSLLIQRTFRELIEAETYPPVMKRAIDENILFYNLQREEDILSELAVMIQSYLVMNMVRRGHIALLRGVEQVFAITVPAMTSAVFVAANVHHATIEALMAPSMRLPFTGAKIGSNGQTFESKRVVEMIAGLRKVDGVIEETKKTIEPILEGTPSTHMYYAAIPAITE